MGRAQAEKEKMMQPSSGTRTLGLIGAHRFFETLSQVLLLRMLGATEKGDVCSDDSDRDK
jgi:hypothetical protein